MACNCKTQDEINKLYDAYGLKLKENNGNFKDYIKKIILLVLSFFMWILVFPIILVYVLLVLFWKDNPTINVQNLNLMNLGETIKKIGNIFKYD